MAMEKVANYVKEKMNELIKEIVSPPAGEGKELEFEELTAGLRQKIRVLHGGASALFATSTGDLMAVS
jgi:hypothetical protein